MLKSFPCLSVSIVALAAFGFGTWFVDTARAEIPNRSAENLEKSAAHVVTADVVRVYRTVKRTSRDLEHTYGIAELSVRDIEREKSNAQDNTPQPHYGDACDGDGLYVSQAGGIYEQPAAYEDVEHILRKSVP